MFSSRQQAAAVPRVAFMLVLLFVLLLQCAFTSVSAAAAHKGTSIYRRALQQGSSSCWLPQLGYCVDCWSGQWTGGCQGVIYCWSGYQWVACHGGGPAIQPIPPPGNTPAPPPQTNSKCPNKQVRIHRFCIMGADDSGPSGEFQFRLQGRKYFPNRAGDCQPQDPTGFCELRENQCHNLNAPWQNALAHRSLDVGVEEHDSTSENDSASVSLPVNDWYTDDCGTYEVRFSKDFKQKTRHDVCWSVGGSVGGNVKGVDVTLNGGVKSCSSWTDPAESYVWYMEVRTAV